MHHETSYCPELFILFFCFSSRMYIITTMILNWINILLPDRVLNYTEQAYPVKILVPLLLARPWLQRRRGLGRRKWGSSRSSWTSGWNPTLPMPSHSATRCLSSRRPCKSHWTFFCQSFPIFHGSGGRTFAGPICSILALSIATCSDDGPFLDAEQLGFEEEHWKFGEEWCYQHAVHGQSWLGGVHASRSVSLAPFTNSQPTKRMLTVFNYPIK